MTCRLRGVGRVSSFLVTAAFAASVGASPRNGKTSHSKDPRPTLYMVGYSHLDTQWCWTYPQVIREFIPNTLHENFALFKKYPDYVFNWTGSNRYRFMKEYYPADYKTLKKYVAEGRWFPAGSSIEEGDVNSPSEESLVRQVMYGNEFFRREFGVASDEFMLPDCFGFPASLPSILAHCGLKGFSTQKLTWGSAVGIPFQVGKWVGPDGRYIVAALNAGDYTASVKDNLADDGGWVSQLQKDKVNDGVAVDYHYFGVGDRGGAPGDSSAKNIEASLTTDGPVHVMAGRADQMFDDLTSSELAGLPQYKGDLELTQHSAGSITSETAMKRWNRKNELLANETESSSVAADWLGAAPYDKDRITDAWLRFLPGQFHDLMAGTALPLAYTYTWNDEILAMNEFAGVLKESVGGVARAMNTDTRGVPITVYNPLSVDRKDDVEAEVTYTTTPPRNVQVFDKDGRKALTQVIERAPRSLKIVFLAHVPSLGYAVYDVRPSSTSDKAAGSMKVGKTGLQNSRYKVTLNAAGDVASVYDKLLHKELLAAPARLAFMYEKPSMYPAWNMDWRDQRKAPYDYVGGKPKVEVIEHGPVRVALRITRRYKGSKFVQTLQLGTGDAANRLDFVSEIDWLGTNSALKAVFPMTSSNPQATYTWGLGTIKRGNDEPKRYEVASHGWIDLTNSNGSYGASVLDDCKYGSDKPNDNTIRLTLIYTPAITGSGYAHQATQDWGRNNVTYSLMGHAGSWQSGGTQWEAAELNQPLLAFQAEKHYGTLGRQFSFAKTSTKGVSIEALKQAEDGHQVVVRLNELVGKDHPGTQVSFAAPIISAKEIDGQERPIGPATIKDGRLIVDATPYEPRAFEVTLGQPATKLSAPTSHFLNLPYNERGISAGFGKTANFDGSGNSLPGDLVPSKIVSDGVAFKTGPKGANNIVTCRGQVVALPAGRNRKLYILGASTGIDLKVGFRFGKTTEYAPLQSWKGYIGQWDSRQWGGVVPELTYDWHNPIVGLVPGYIKRQPVAWYADHIRQSDGGNDIYAFCYLFRSEIPIPDGATKVVLPNNSKAKLAALTVASDPDDSLVAAQPLYDVLERRNIDPPTISVDEPSPHGQQVVTVHHPLYWSTANPLRYTTDGTTPTLASPAYEKPFSIGKSCTVSVAQVEPNGSAPVVIRKEAVVDDTTAPAITSVVSLSGASTVTIQFSEQLDSSSAKDPAHYSVESGPAVQSAQLSADGLAVTLNFSGPVSDGASLHVDGVQDIGGNPCNQTLTVQSLAPVATVTGIKEFDGSTDGLSPASVPDAVTRANSPWTINMFVKTEKRLGDLSIIGGFGSGQDDGGAERFLIYFNRHLSFWGSGVDLDGGVGLSLNKWQMITATYDGHKLSLYKDGVLVASTGASFSDADGSVKLAPSPAWDYGHKFAGSIANFSVWDQALPASFVQTLLKQAPNP